MATNLLLGKEQTVGSAHMCIEIVWRAGRSKGTTLPGLCSLGPFHYDFRWKHNEMPTIGFHFLAVTFPLKCQWCSLARVSRAILGASQSIKSYLKVQCMLMEISSCLNPDNWCKWGGKLGWHSVITRNFPSPLCMCTEKGLFVYTEKSEAEGLIPFLMLPENCILCSYKRWFILSETQAQRPQFCCLLGNSNSH